MPALPGPLTLGPPPPNRDANEADRPPILDARTPECGEICGRVTIAGRPATRISPRGAGERRVASWLEGGLLLALIVALLLANGKMVEMFGKIGVSWTRALPVSALFVGAAYLALRRFRALRRGEGGGVKSR